MVFYAGTNLGEGAIHQSEGLRRLLTRILKQSGISPTLHARNASAAVHVDAIPDSASPEFIIQTSKSDSPQTITLQSSGLYQGIFSSRTLDLSRGESEIHLDGPFSDIFVRTQPAKQTAKDTSSPA